MKSVRKNKQKRRSIFGGTKKSKSLSLTKEFEIIEKKNEKHTNYIWMNAFNKILNEIKKKIEKTKFINKHSFTQFLKVYKPYLKIKKIVEKLKAAGNSTISVKMYTFEKNVIEGKFKKIEQQNKKKIVLDELKQKKPRVKSMLSRSSPKKKKRNSVDSKRKKRRSVSSRRKKRHSVSSKNMKREKLSSMKNSLSFPNFIIDKPTPVTPNISDFPMIVGKKTVL